MLSTFVAPVTKPTMTSSVGTTLPLTCVPRVEDFANRAAVKMRFIWLVEQFDQLTEADADRWEELDEYWHLELEWTFGHPVPFEMVLGWRDTLHFLLRQARARMHKNHPQFYHPFPANESAFLRAYHASHCPKYPTTTRLTTILGYPLTNGITRLVVGDYGPYIEFSSEQLVAQLASKFPGTPRRPVKYIWLEHPKDPRTKVYHQQRTVQYADYQPGMYYVSPDQVWAYG